MFHLPRIPPFQPLRLISRRGLLIIAKTGKSRYDEGIKRGGEGNVTTNHSTYYRYRTGLFFPKQEEETGSDVEAHVNFVDEKKYAKGEKKFIELTIMIE